VGEEEDKAPMVLGLKEPVKFCFFASNNWTNFLNFSRMKGNEFLNFVLTKILKMKSSFFRILISKFVKFLKIQIQSVGFAKPMKLDRTGFVGSS
jgi:uncharacterized UBP type Zn finger protein